MAPKQLMGLPWRLAFALQDDGWYLRQDIIWSKPNPMPEAVNDRCTKAHEYLFLLTKADRYFYDVEAVKETLTGGAHARRLGTGVGLGYGFDAQPKPRAVGVGPKAAQADSGTKYNSSFSAAVVDIVDTRNKRSVWTIATEGFAEAHFATFPTALVEPCILAGTSEHGCCAACGAPWRRAIEKFATGATQKMPDGMAVGNYAHGSILVEGRRKGEPGKPVMGFKTTGWAPTCKCDLPAVPAARCTVLDPFNGSGTTGVVAQRLGREYIGIELSPEYVKMARRRLDRFHLRRLPKLAADVGGLFAEHDGEALEEQSKGGVTQ